METLGEEGVMKNGEKSEHTTDLLSKGNAQLAIPTDNNAQLVIPTDKPYSIAAQTSSRVESQNLIGSPQSYLHVASTHLKQSDEQIAKSKSFDISIPGNSAFKNIKQTDLKGDSRPEKITSTNIELESEETKERYLSIKSHTEGKFDNVDTGVSQSEKESWNNKNERPCLYKPKLGTECKLVQQAEANNSPTYGEEQSQVSNKESAREANENSRKDIVGDYGKLSIKKEVLEIQDDIILSDNNTAREKHRSDLHDPNAKQGAMESAKNVEESTTGCDLNKCKFLHNEHDAAVINLDKERSQATPVKVSFCEAPTSKGQNTVTDDRDSGSVESRNNTTKEMQPSSTVLPHEKSKKFKKLNKTADGDLPLRRSSRHTKPISYATFDNQPEVDIETETCDGVVKVLLYIDPYDTETSLKVKVDGGRIKGYMFASDTVESAKQQCSSWCTKSKIKIPCFSKIPCGETLAQPIKRIPKLHVAALPAFKKALKTKKKYSKKKKPIVKTTEKWTVSIQESEGVINETDVSNNEESVLPDNNGLIYTSNDIDSIQNKSVSKIKSLTDMKEEINERDSVDLDTKKKKVPTATLR